MKRFVYPFFMLTCAMLLAVAFGPSLASPTDQAPTLKRAFSRLVEVNLDKQIHYTDPRDGRDYIVDSPLMAYRMMTALGIGVSNANLSKIPVDSVNFNVGLDSDNDALSDRVELAFGTDTQKADTDGDGYNDRDEVMNGYDSLSANGRKLIDIKFTDKLKSQILIQVQSRGEAWFIDPVDRRRVYLGNADEAYATLRKVLLGEESVKPPANEPVVVAPAIDMFSAEKLLPFPADSLSKGDSQPIAWPTTLPVGYTEPTFFADSFPVGENGFANCGTTDLLTKLGSLSNIANFYNEYRSDNGMVCFGNAFFNNCSLANLKVVDSASDSVMVSVIGQEGGNCMLRVERLQSGVTTNYKYAYCAVTRGQFAQNLENIKSQPGYYAGALYYSLAYNFLNATPELQMNCAMIQN